MVKLWTTSEGRAGAFVLIEPRKELHAELARRRTELKVPAQDPTGTGGNPGGGAAKKGKAKAK